jgi:hypothetical protein
MLVYLYERLTQNVHNFVRRARPLHQPLLLCEQRLSVLTPDMSTPPAIPGRARANVRCRRCRQ